MTTGAPPPLTRKAFAAALGELAQRDSDLAGIVNRLGPPPLWTRRQGFATLIHLILEQQVSLASARAAFERLQAAVGDLTPRRFLALDDEVLQLVGFSRQKITYARGLAVALAEGRLDLEGLARRSDDEVRSELTRIKGIGSWTAEVYLLMALRRPDAWPAGDLALARAVADLRGWHARPGADELAEVAEPWRPWRAVAARVLWHHYLSGLPPLGKPAADP